MRYIDADRLRAEIERMLDELNPKTGMLGDRPLRAVNPKTFPRERDLEKVLYLIDSLQQEKQTDRQVVVITESHGYANIEWDCRSIDDVKGLLAAGAHYVSKHQEQPEVDLDEEVEKYFQGFWPGMETAEQCNTDMHFTPPAIMRLARHFYELGLNARKEE